MKRLFNLPMTQLLRLQLIQLLFSPTLLGKLFNLLFFFLFLGWFRWSAIRRLCCSGLAVRPRGCGFYPSSWLRSLTCCLMLRQRQFLQPDLGRLLFLLFFLSDNRTHSLPGGTGHCRPKHVSHKSKPAPVLRTYGSTRKSTSAEPAAPAAIATKFVDLPAVLTHAETHASLVFSTDNSDGMLSDLFSRSDDDNITLPVRLEVTNSFSSFDVDDLHSNGQELTSIREEDSWPFMMQDLDYDEIEGMRQECESKDTAYCFRYAGGTTRYYHGRELIEGCQTAADWFTKYLDDDTNKWHSTLQCPTYSCRNPVIPVEFRWNPQEFRWNSTGIRLE